MKPHLATLFLLIAAPLLPAPRAQGAEKKAEPIQIATLQRTTPVVFETEILPFLRASCIACHSRTTAKASLVLETPQTILKGSEDGPVVVPGKSSDSQLLDLAAHGDKPIMPPRDNKASAPDLTPDQLALLKLWIDQGARGEVHAEAIHWGAIAPAFTPAYATAISPDGQFAAVNRANRLDLYDLAAQQPLPPLVDPKLPGQVAHRDAIYALAFSPDGTRLASGSFGEVKIWRRIAPTSTSSSKKLTGDTLVANSSDGKRSASASGSGTVKVSNRATGAILFELKGDPALNKLVVRSETDDKLAAADIAYLTGVLNAAQTGEKTQRDRALKSTAAKVAADKIAAEKQALVKVASAAKVQAERALADASAQRDKALKALADAERDRKATEAHPTGSTTQPASTRPTTLSSSTRPVAESGTALAARVKAVELAKSLVATSEAQLKEASQRLAASAKPLAAAESALKISQLAASNATNESDLAAAAVSRAQAAVAEAQLSLVQAQELKKKREGDLGKARQNFNASTTRPVRSLAFSPSGRTLAVARQAGSVQLYSGDTGLPLQAITPPKGQIISVAFQDESHLLGASTDSTSAIWDIAPRWMLERTLGTGEADSPLSDRVNALAFSPDGRILASGAGEPTRGGEIKLWNVQTGALVREFKDAHSDAVLALAFSRDGARLASGAADRNVRVFDVSSGRRVFSLEGHAHHVLSVAFKADDRTLLSGAADGQAKLWNLVSGERMGNVPSVTKEITSVHFFGITDQALLGSSDGLFRVINSAGAPVRTFSGPSGDHVHAAALGLDEKTLLIATQSGTLHVYDASTGKLQISFPPSDLQKQSPPVHP